MLRLIAAGVALVMLAAAAEAAGTGDKGRTSGKTRTQSYHPGEPKTGLPGGAPGRGTVAPAPLAIPGLPALPGGAAIGRVLQQPPLLMISRIHQFWREAFANCGWDFDDGYAHGESARNRSAYYIFSHQHPPPPEVPEALYYNERVLYADVHPVTARGVYTSEITLAHEIGHRVQDLLGTAAGRWRQETELEADFFAGAYVNWLEGRGEAPAGLVTAGNVSRRVKGDPPGTPWNDPQSHGSGIQRGTAFMDGVWNGLPPDFCDRPRVPLNAEKT